MPRKMKTALVSAAGAAMLVAGAATLVGAQHGTVPSPRVAFLSDHSAVPFELFRGTRIIVPATIDGRHTPMMLDSAASTTTIDRAFARSIGLPEGQKIRGHGAGGDVDAEIVPGVTLDVGGIRFTNMSVAVMDLTPITRAIGRPINVILGREFFNSAVVSINWANKQLKVSSPAAFTPDPGAREVELGKNGPFNTIPISVLGGPPIDALFDLGSGGALTLPPTDWRSRQELTQLRSAPTMLGGVGGLHSGHSAIVPKVTLAGTEFANVPTIMADAGNDHDPTVMPNVGIGLLEQFTVDLDLGRDRVYLAPRKDHPMFEHDRSGVLFELAGDRLKALFVSPGGPAAAAGLKQGDEIVSIDGRPAQRAYVGAADWSRAPQGTSVVLSRADGSKVTIKLADYY